MATSRRRPRRGGRLRRRTLALALALLVALATGVASLAAIGDGGPPPSTAGAVPELGPAGFGTGSNSTGTRLLGAVPGGASGEVWGYRELPPWLSAPVVDGRVLTWGAGAPSQRLALVRYTDESGWQIFDNPLDVDGNAYPGISPYVSTGPAGRMTPAGGGALIGPRIGAPGIGAILRRDPGGRFRELPAPDLSDGGALGSSVRAPLAVFDASGGRTAVLAAPVGRAPAEDAVLAWDGDSWSEESICAPRAATDPPATPGACAAFEPGETFSVLALSAAGPDDAWLLGAADPTLGRGVVLMRRIASDGPPHWVEHELGAGGARFANASSGDGTVTAVTALAGRADPLTATPTGVWVDGTLKLVADGTERDFTLRVSDDATASWCDPAGVCDRPFGFRFSRNPGYQSVAWDGPGFGTRLVTNPLDPSGSESSSRGTYLRFDGETSDRRPGAGWRDRRTAAFRSVDDGWLDGPVRVGGAPAPQRLARWPVPVRNPFLAIAAAPGGAPGDLGAGALAVGNDGAVARYEPGQGWNSEYLMTSYGTVSKPRLRGVAWPEARRAHAVGDEGAMWLWRAETGFWERDPGAPLNFDSQLNAVAFQPGDPERGYAVGRTGTVLSYGKSWEPDTAPAGFETADFTSVAFAGSQALAVADGRLLVNDGGGWRPDSGANALLDSIPAPKALYVVAGLADGGAVAAGRGVVLERDGQGAPWRTSDQPLPDMTVIAAGAFREAGPVRAVVSVLPGGEAYPPPDNLPQPDPNTRPPLRPPFPPPTDGYLLRQTAHGWRDEQRLSYGDPGIDKPLKPDPILALALSSAGDGWAVGGWSGGLDRSLRGSQETRERNLVQTAGIYHYSPGVPVAAPGARSAPIALDPGPFRLAAGGNARCEDRCADLAPLSLAPDRTLATALAKVAALTGRPGGPGFFLYTGGRVAPGRADADEQRRYAELLRSAPGLSTYAAAADGDSAPGLAPFASGFADAPAPFGDGAPPPGVTPVDVTGAAVDSARARTHYAFDATRAEGTVRVVVIDNSAGSLAASDPHQNPAEPQRPWLTAVLDDARTRGIPALVMGNRDLNVRFSPALNVAEDGQEIAELLRDHGASAYLFDRPEENRSYPIPSASADTIPSFGTGSLGYRSPVEISSDRALSVFGDPAFLLLELDLTRRDPATNRVPVTARLTPIAEDLSLEAVDGTVLRRSRVALFRGLARRPVAGDRWGGAVDGARSPSGSDPYTTLPGFCATSACSTALRPEYSFTSSDPDIADFVRQDPASSNPRKPFLNAAGKVVTDSQSSLVCTFNAGTATISVASGGLSYSRTLRVLGGSPLRPCGTRPLRPDRFVRKTIVRRSPGAGAPPPPPPPPPLVPLALVPPVPAPPPPPVARVLPAAVPAALLGVPLATLADAALPRAPLPPQAIAGRPTPPGGAVARVQQVEEKREEEAAIEESQAFSRYEADDGGPSPLMALPALVLIAALAGSARPGAGRRRRARVTPASASPAGEWRPPPAARHQGRPRQ